MTFWESMFEEKEELGQEHEKLKKEHGRLRERHLQIYSEFLRTTDKNVSLHREVFDLRRVIRAFHHSD